MSLSGSPYTVKYFYSHIPTNIYCEYLILCSYKVIIIRNSYSVLWIYSKCPATSPRCFLASSMKLETTEYKIALVLG